MILLSPFTILRLLCTVSLPKLSDFTCFLSCGRGAALPCPLGRPLQHLRVFPLMLLDSRSAHYSISGTLYLVTPAPKMFSRPNGCAQRSRTQERMGGDEVLSVD